MAGRQSLDILFNIVIFLVNFLNFTTAEAHLIVEGQLAQLLPTPSPQLVSYFSFLLNSEAAIYYVAAAVTILICLANFLLVWVPKKSMALRNFQFFATVIMGCFQSAVVVVSGVSNTLFQENYGVAIANVPSLNNLQILILSCLCNGLCLVLPVTTFLLYEKWSSLSRAIMQEGHGQVLSAKEELLMSTIRRY